MVSDDDMHRNSKFFQSIDKDVLEAVQGNVVNKLTTINNVAKMKNGRDAFFNQLWKKYIVIKLFKKI